MATALALAVVGNLVTSPAPPAHADQTQADVDNLRTGWDPNEPGLTPAGVQSSDFGSLFSTQLDGQIYAQPVLANGTLVVVTESNHMYGLDPVSGAIRWHRSVGPAWPAAAIACGDLTPTIGMTATPVYDPTGDWVYATAKVNDGPTAGQPSWYLHAFSPADGAERPGWPVKIQGAPSNDPTNPFDAMRQLQRPGLLLLGGRVYAGFGAHCDVQPYRGLIVGVSTTTRAISMFAATVGASSGGGIWQSGGGLVSDGPNRIFASTGNGVLPAPGTPPAAARQLGNSVFRLDVDPATGVMTTADYFVPKNADELNTGDVDLGSGAPTALPSAFGAGTATPNLLAQIGKDGRLFLLNRDNLGGRGETTDNVVSSTGPWGGVWGHPSAWNGHGGLMYIVLNDHSMLAFANGTDATGRAAVNYAGTSGEDYGYTSGSPLITSSGSTPGTGTVWVVTCDGPTGANGVLRAFDALPQAGRLKQIWSAPIGTAAKFSRVGSGSNRVYVGTRDGKVFGFGRPTTAALTGGSVDFGNVAVGTTKAATAVFTATRTITVTATSAAGEFQASAPAGGLPVTLTAGQTIAVPVSFTPGDPGTSSGRVSLALGDGSSVSAGLIGAGTRPGLGATPQSLEFPTMPTGISRTLTVQVLNTGTSPVTITGVQAPTGQFSATMPTAGRVVAVGGSLSIPVTWTPTTAGNQTTSLSLTSAEGVLTVPITGQAVTGVQELVITPAANFGRVPVGRFAVMDLVVSNDGNLPVTITKAKAPAGAFTGDVPLPEGLTLAPDESFVVKVRFAPTATGVQTAQYEVTADDGVGARFLNLAGEGTAVPYSVQTADPGPAWTFNGDSSGSAAPAIQVTGPVMDRQGSALANALVPSKNLDATFVARFPAIDQQGRGVTMALLNGATTPATALGGGSQGLGFGGLDGYAVGLGTYWDNGAASNSFVGIAQAAGSSTGQLNWVTSTPWPGLRQASHAVNVRYDGTTLTVSVDGRLAVQAAVVLPSQLRVGFTGATGFVGGTQVVDSVTIRSGQPLPVNQVQPPAPVFLDRCGTGRDQVNLPVRTGVRWVLNGASVVPGFYPARGTMRVTAVAQTGYTLTGTTSWTQTMLADACQATGKLGDQTGDGVADVFGLDGNQTLTFAKGSATGPLLLAGQRPHNSGAVRAMAQVADRTGDGRSDLLVLGGDGRLLLYPSQGMGWLASPIVVATGWTTTTRIVAVGDIGGTGTQYLLAITTDGRMHRWAWSGTTLSGDTTLMTGWGYVRTVVPLGDYNGDGFADIAGVYADGTVRLFMGRANATINGNSVLIASGWQVFTALALPGDLTGDGRADVVGRRSDGTVMVLPVLGNGRWGTARVVATGWSSRLLLA